MNFQNKCFLTRLYALSFFFVLFSFIAEAQQPQRLRVDLLEHTEQAWENGFLSSLKAEESESAIESLQMALVESALPRFSWEVTAQTPSTKQSAYRILVSDNRKDAENHKGNIWDSGWQESKQSVAVPYQGDRLQPNKIYYWRVQTRTNTEGEGPWSEIKVFRTASQLADYAVSHYPITLTEQWATELSQTPQGNTLIDFGKDAFARLRMTLTAQTPHDTVVIHLGETLSAQQVNRRPGGTIRYRRIVLPLQQGTYTYQIKIPKDTRNTGNSAIKMPSYIGEVMPFRYCELEGYKYPIKHAQIVREAAFYPFCDEASHFSCSNDTLTAIWDLCKYSIKATSFAGYYVDGDRERIPYEADALINQLSHYGVDREFSLARRSYEYLLNSPTWPTEWILQAILIAWNDYLYTGDLRSLAATYDKLRPRTLLALREKNGLVSTTTGLQTKAFQESIHFNGTIKDIVDWPHTGILGLNKETGGETDGFVFTNYNVVTNAFHYECLKRMATMAEALQKPEDATFYNHEATTFHKRFNDAFYQSQTGAYRDGVDAQHASLHGNMFPVVFGLASEKQKPSVIEFLKTRGMACSVYGSQFLMEALYDTYAADYALHMLTKGDDRSWYNMLKVGSTITLEAWDNKYKPNQDWNHAWGAAPANIIPRKLMGVEPKLPGFELAEIRPQIGSLDWAEATVPSIRGDIKLLIKQRVSTYELTITLPANMEADIFLPYRGRSYKLLADGSPLKARKEANRPFLALGRVGSGTHTFILTTD